MANVKMNRLNMEEMQTWAQQAFRLQGDGAAEEKWSQKALKRFVRAGLANYRSDMEEAKAKVLFLAMVAFYYEFWGIFFSGTEYIHYYDWAYYFKKSGQWIGLLAQQRGLRTEEISADDSEDDREEALVEDLEALANDLRGQMLAGFKKLLGDSSEIFLFFHSACGESDRDEVLGNFDPERQAAFEFVDAEVGALPELEKTKNIKDVGIDV